MGRVLTGPSGLSGLTFDIGDQAVQGVMDLVAMLVLKEDIVTVLEYSRSISASAFSPFARSN